MIALSPGWVDRVDVLEPSIRAVGHWNLPETLAIFDAHFPRFPVVPGTIMLQALVELAIVVVQDADRPVWELHTVDDIRFRRYVRPGDELELLVDVIDHGAHTIGFRARGTLEGIPVMTIGRLELIATEAGERADG